MVDAPDKFNSFTPIRVQSSDGNEKLPPHRFSTVGIVRKVLAITNKTILQTSSPWQAVCPSSGVDLTDPPNPTQITSLDRVG